MACLHCLHHEACDAVLRLVAWKNGLPRKRCLPEKRLSARFPATERALSLPSRKRAASPPRQEWHARHRSQPSQGCTDSSRPPIERHLLASFQHAQGGPRDRRNGNEVLPRLFMGRPSADKGPTETGHKIALGNQAQSCAGIAGKLATQASAKPWTRKPWTPAGAWKTFFSTCLQLSEVLKEKRRPSVSNALSAMVAG